MKMNYKEIAKEIVEIVNKQDSLYNAVDLVEEFLIKMNDPNTILLTKNDKEKFFSAVFDENKDIPKIEISPNPKGTSWFDNLLKNNPNR